MGRQFAGDLGSVIFGMVHILALFCFLPNVYFKIWVFIMRQR